MTESAEIGSYEVSLLRAIEETEEIHRMMNEQYKERGDWTAIPVEDGSYACDIASSWQGGTRGMGSRLRSLELAGLVVRKSGDPIGTRWRMTAAGHAALESRRNSSSSGLQDGSAPK